MVASKSFARRRLRLIQAKNRSTTQRLGCTAKPIWPGCARTISKAICSGAQSKCGRRAIEGGFRRKLAETVGHVRRTLFETERLFRNVVSTMVE